MVLGASESQIGSGAYRISIGFLPPGRRCACRGRDSSLEIFKNPFRGVKQAAIWDPQSTPRLPTPKTKPTAFWGPDSNPILRPLFDRYRDYFGGFGCLTPGTTFCRTETLVTAHSPAVAPFGNSLPAVRALPLWCGLDSDTAKLSFRSR